MLDSSVTISAFIHKLCKWAHLYCWQFNTLVTNWLSHPYHFDESTLTLGAAGVTFHFILHLLHIHRQKNCTVYHGGDTDVPGLRRYRPDAAPVETRLLPAASRFITVFDSLPGYSRWVPVVLNILKQPGTWAGLTRFNTVHPGSPRLSTVPPRLWHGSSRFIPDHQTGVNRHLKPGQWERGLTPLSSSYWYLGVKIESTVWHTSLRHGIRVNERLEQLFGEPAGNILKLYYIPTYYIKLAPI